MKKFTKIFIAICLAISTIMVITGHTLEAIYVMTVAIFNNQNQG